MRSGFQVYQSISEVSNSAFTFLLRLPLSSVRRFLTFIPAEDRRAHTHVPPPEAQQQRCSVSMYVPAERRQGL